jgi:RND family efflux transporter MFP subunit
MKHPTDAMTSQWFARGKRWRLGVWGWVAVVGLALLVSGGCTKQPAPTPSVKPPDVVVARPLVRTVTDYEDFTGRTEAYRTIEVRARVSGYLNKVNFVEGSEVKKGEVLFEIDPRLFEAQLQRANAVLNQAQAHLRRLDQDLDRATSLLPRNAISREEYDKIAGDRSEAAAAVSVARASVETAKLNLAYTKVVAPISGRISRRLLDPGNLIKADETVLTSIVSDDPIYAYFDIDERTLLRLRRMVRQTQAIFVRKQNVPVMLGLSDEEGFPHVGKIDFSDNRLDPMTGTLRVRGVFDNPQHLLSPGLFVRIRLPIGHPYEAILIAEQALGTDQGQKFVYVVNEQNEVEYRRVQVGSVFDGLRVITEGLSKDERVIISGLQRARAGLVVEPRQVEMPTEVGVVVTPIVGPPLAGTNPPTPTFRP